MRTRIETAEYQLDAAAVDAITAGIDGFFHRLHIQKENHIRMRLVLEDILLRLLDHAPNGVNCVVTMGRRTFGRPFIELVYDGDRYDPTAELESEDSWNRRLMADMGFAPTWGWHGGRNRVVLQIKTGKNRITAALPAAVVLGAVLSTAGLSLPEATRTALLDSLLTPVFEAFLGLMVTFVGLTLFLSVCRAVFGVGDTVAFGRYGKRLLLRFVGLSFLTAAVVTILYQPFFRFAGSDFTRPGELFSELLRLIFIILPRDPVTPFLVNDSLQLIFLGTVAGLALIAFGDRAQELKTVLAQGSDLISLVMATFSRLTPIFVCITIIRAVWLGSMSILLGMWKPFVIFLAISCLYMLAKLLQVSLRENVPVRLLAEKLRPAFLIALTTASASAAFGESMKTTVRRLGVSERLAGFALPMGGTMYMPCSVCAFLLTAFYLAEAYQTQVDYAWFITAAIVCTMMAIAMPPVPGSGLGCYSIMLTQLGIPAEGLVVAATLDVFFDFLTVALDNALLQLELVLQADRMQMLDREALTAPESARLSAR